MVTIVDINGLPDSCKLPKLLYLFKTILKKEGVNKFWIRDLSGIRGTKFKSARIEFEDIDQAYRSITVLDGFIYRTGFKKYPLTAEIAEDRYSPYDRRSRERYEDRDRHRFDRYHRYSRDRSRSPISYEASKLDLEIELLRKQRMIIEEERKILLERKKLEMVKEYGPSALKEFEYLERSDDRRYRERSHDYRYRRSPSPRRERPPPRPLPRMAQLPQFFMPCKMLLAEMKDVLNKLGTKQENFLLTKLVRSSIRKRIALSLEGKPIMPGAKIVELYRQKYPKESDESLIMSHLNDLRDSHVPPTKKICIPDENSTNDQPEANTGDMEAQNNDQNKTQETDAAGDDTDLKEEKDLVNQEAGDLDGNPADNGQDQDPATIQHEYAGSVDSSEVALALHDKNDEDWAEGVDEWKSEATVGE